MSEVEANDLLAHAHVYYQQAACREHIRQAFTELTYQPGYTETDASKIAIEAAAFARDCRADALTPFQLDYAVGQWRRKDTAFMPSYGQFLSLARQANGFQAYMPYENHVAGVLALHRGAS